jgi:hypothetical protein
LRQHSYDALLQKENAALAAQLDTLAAVVGGAVEQIASGEKDPKKRAALEQVRERESGRAGERAISTFHSPHSFVRSFIHPSNHPPVHPSVRPPIHQPIHLSLHSSLRPALNPSTQSGS